MPLLMRKASLRKKRKQQARTNKLPHHKIWLSPTYGKVKPANHSYNNRK